MVSGLLLPEGVDRPPVEQARTDAIARLVMEARMMTERHIFARSPADLAKIAVVSIRISPPRAHQIAQERVGRSRDTSIRPRPGVPRARRRTRRRR